MAISFHVKGRIQALMSVRAGSSNLDMQNFEEEPARNKSRAGFRGIVGKHRPDLHACYLDSDDAPDRDTIEYRHFNRWVDWARDQGIGLGFNPTFFAHPKEGDNLMLSHWTTRQAPCN